MHEVYVKLVYILFYSNWIRTRF